MGESWLPVVGYEDVYEVSDQGNVRSLPRTVVRKNGVSLTVDGRDLLPTANRHGDMRVTLCRPGSQKVTKVAHLVAEAFIGPKPPGMEICHTNTDASDNRVENLRWDTHQENVRDIRKNGKGPASRTRCPRGHEYSPENTHVTPMGYRECKKCVNRRSRERNERVRAAREVAGKIDEYGNMKDA